MEVIYIVVLGVIFTLAPGIIGSIALYVRSRNWRFTFAVGAIIWLYFLYLILQRAKNPSLSLILLIGTINISIILVYYGSKKINKWQKTKEIQGTPAQPQKPTRHAQSVFSIAVFIIFSIIRGLMHRFSTLTYWLPKIPLLALIATFALPIVLMQVNYHLGLFFIAFYISYWSVKVFEGYYYVLKSYIKLLKTEGTNWSENTDIAKRAKKLKHIVIVPIYTEPYDVIEENILSIIATEYHYKENITVLLAVEERASESITHAEGIIREHGEKGINIVSIIHPSEVEGEGKVKGSNITHAIKTYEKMVTLDAHETFVSSIDTDTKVERDFFSIVTYRFINTDCRDQAIYQYTPIYSNNWHTGHFFARIIGMGTTLWQFFESQNPEFYRNFAVYGQSLRCLQKANYWSLTSIVEDGMQYWRSYFGWGGVFRIIHTPAVCEMDLVDEKNLYRTVRSQYKQLRRWSWGCTDIEFVLPGFVRATNISTWEKIRKTIYLTYNHLFWAGGPFMLFFIGYVPGLVTTIDQSIAAFTVPIASSIIFTILFATIVVPSILSIHIMRRYVRFTPVDYIWNIIQWIAVPVLTLTLFSIPAIESQIRLFFGKRIDTFDTTEKMQRK